jgi:hypothetical protein
MQGRLMVGIYRLLALCWVLLACAICRAQTDHTITILMLDSQSGKPITTSELQIWTGETSASAKTGGISPRYVKPDNAGLAEAAFPPRATVFTVHAQYGPAGWGYVNCDRVKDHGAFREHWYSIDEAVSSGIAAPNLCSKQKAVAKPGQFVFFVRPMSSWEKFHQ